MRAYHFPKRIITNITYIILLGGAGMLAYNSPNRVTIDLFLLLFLSGIIDVIHFIFSFYQLQITPVDGSKSAEKNEAVKIKFILKNKSLLPIAYVYLKSYDGCRLTLNNKELCLFLGPKEEVTLTIEYEAKLCGKQKIGIESIYFVDYLFFFKKQLKWKQEREIKVLPEIRTFEGEAIFEVTKAGLKATKEQGDISYQLEPYQIGDSLRLLHWKIVAQKEVYLVRTREEEQAASARLIFILNPLDPIQSNDEEAYSLVDQTLMVYLSLADQLVIKGQQITLMYFKNNKWEKYSIKKRQDLQLMREKLSDYESIMGQSKEEYRKVFLMLHKALEKETGFRLLLTSHWHKEMAHYLEKNKESFVKTQVVLVEEAKEALQRGQL